MHHETIPYGVACFFYRCGGSPMICTREPQSKIVQSSIKSMIRLIVLHQPILATDLVVFHLSIQFPFFGFKAPFFPYSLSSYFFLSIFGRLFSLLPPATAVHAHCNADEQHPAHASQTDGQGFEVEPTNGPSNFFPVAFTSAWKSAREWVIKAFTG